MNTLSPRDRWLATILPALVILLGGWIFFLRPSGKEAALLRQRVANQGSPTDRRQLVNYAHEERAALEKQIAAKKEAIARESSAFDHNAGMQQVSMLCTEFGISLNVASAEMGSTVPLVLKDAAALLATGGRQAPVTWRIELSGSYGSVLKLLDGLAKSKPLIVPLNLSMTSAQDTRTPPTWTLTLWL